MTPDDKYNVGWAYILIICVNIFINFSKILNKIIYEAIPDLYRKYKKRKDQKWYKAKLDKWIEQKLKFCKENPNVVMVDEMQELTEITSNLRTARVVIMQLENKIESQKKWLENYGLDSTCLTPLIEELESR